MKRFIVLVTTLLTSSSGAGGADPLQPYYDFIRRQPQDIAIQVLNQAPGGQQQTVMTWNAAEPMPLASSMKIVVLAAYARAVAAGILKPEQTVTVDDWESFYLPSTDGGAHVAALKALKIPADRNGRAVNGKQTVTLDQLARFMIEVSDNAATDMLLAKLDHNAVPNTIKVLGLKGQEDIAPLSGMYTAWGTEGTRYLKLTPEQRRVRDWALSKKVQTTPALRDPTTLAKQAGSGDLTQAISLANQTPPRGTVEDYATLMSRVLSGEGFSTTERAVMQRHLGWPMRVNPDNVQVFKQFYAKGGSFGGGVLTNTFAFELNNGNRIVYSVFLRNIPLSLYPKLSSGLEQFMMTTLSDPNAQKKLLAALDR